MKKGFYGISQTSSKILLFGLPVIIICFIYLLISFTTHENVSHSVLLHIYTPQLEHFMMSLTILVTGAVLIDITEKEVEQIKK